MLEITSTKNPLIKEVKSLYNRKERWTKGLFIIEGIKIIEEAIVNKIELKYILFTDKLLSTEDGKVFYESIKNKYKIVSTSESVFKEISDTDNPQGVVGVAKFNISILSEDLNKDNLSLIFLDGVQDPGNMGTIIRTCDAFKLDGIILGKGSVDPYNPKVVRATMGSIFRVPLYSSHDSLETLSGLREKGLHILTTSLEGSVPVYHIDYKEGFVLVIGNESKGVDERIIKISDKLIKIPMPGFAESLNAGVAASIIMYEAMKNKLIFLEY